MKKMNRENIKVSYYFSLNWTRLRLSSKTGQDIQARIQTTATFPFANLEKLCTFGETL